MPAMQNTLPSCCSVGIMYQFVGHPGDGWSKLPEPMTKSGHFIAIFTKAQEPWFKEVCKKHTLVSAVGTQGAYHGDTKYLAICVFRKGKEK